MKNIFFLKLALFFGFLIKFTIETDEETKSLTLGKSEANQITNGTNKINYKYYQLTIPSTPETRANKVDLAVKVKSTAIYESFIFPKIFISKVSS